MKKLNPKIDFIKFNTEDVITTSGPDISLTDRIGQRAAEDSPAEDRSHSGLNWNFKQ